MHDCDSDYCREQGSFMTEESVIYYTSVSCQSEFRRSIYAVLWGLLSELESLLG